MSQPTVFISYSRKDEKEKDLVLSHLGVLQQAGLTDVWSDDRISAGADWQKEIDLAISQARVAILLISANYLGSEFILCGQVRELLEHEGITVFPVIAKACAWQQVEWLAKMSVRPKSRKPVWSDAGIHVDEDLAAIAEEVAVILQGTENNAESEHISLSSFVSAKDGRLHETAEKISDTEEFQDREEVIEPGNALKRDGHDEHEIPHQIFAFLTLILFLIAMLGLGYFFKDSLFFLLKRYSKNFGTFVIYIGFAGISLVAAVVVFGILRGTGIFRKTGRHGQYEFGGAVSGFLAILIFLVVTYSIQTKPPHMLQLIGNVRFTEQGKPVGPVSNAKIMLSNFQGLETKTEDSGNFRLLVPENQQIQETEILIIHEGEFYYRTVQRLDMENAIIEIPKPGIIPLVPELPEIHGIIYLVEDGEPDIPVIDAKIMVSELPDIETYTDSSGNFIIQLSENQQFHEAELKVVYEGKIYYYAVQLSNMKNVKIEIKKPGPFEPKIWEEPVTGMEFVWIPAGCYEMGCGSWTSDCFPYEKPVHKACMDGYWIGKNEVTLEQWKKVMENKEKGKELMEKYPSEFKRGENYPVVMVNWHDAKAFIHGLGEHTGEKYRLPTEAEWEYACRSGGRLEKYAGKGETDQKDVDELAWYNINSEQTIHPVGEKEPNEIGLYDMSGNVKEWCEDMFRPDAYKKHPCNNPKMGEGTGRVIRGGSWSSEIKFIRCASRFGIPLNSMGNDIGFRLIRMNSK